jgi:D-serine deaminase-like pyridoxal phosphate-dependent protein
VEIAAEISRSLGRRGGNIRFLVDHISQIKLVERVGELSGYPPRVYILVDIGDCYSGVRPGTPEFQELFSRIEQIVFTQGTPSLDFVGFYSDTTSLDESADQVAHLRLLDRQLAVLLHASPIENVRLTVRAPPSLWTSLRTQQERVSRELSKIQHTLIAASDASDAIEMHGGEYALLDVRSVANDLLGDREEDRVGKYDDIALTILTEVASLYPRRGDNGCVEALISAGGSAIHTQDGVECRGVVSHWNMSSMTNANSDANSGWEIDRCRDDSAVLVWKGEEDPNDTLHCGQRLRIYPYDAKRAINEFGWYYVVDSTRVGREDEIIDIFVRWRG